jgi:hypothetical protein
MELRVPDELRPLLTPISSLKLDPHNARLHNERNLRAITDSLKDFGQIKPIVVLQDGTVVAGNGTLTAAIDLGATQIAVVRWPTNDLEQAQKFALVDNRTAELATWDRNELAALMQGLGGDSVDLPGWDAGEIRQLLDSSMRTVFGGDTSGLGNGTQVPGMTLPANDGAGADLPEGEPPVAAPGSPVGAYVPVTYSILGEHRPTVDAAMKAAKQRGLATNSGEALVAVCRAFLETPQ